MSWWWIFAALGTFVTVTLLSILARIVSARIKLQYYKNQGVPIIFAPALGSLAIFSRDQPENKLKSNIEFAKKLASQSTVGAFAVNTFSEQTSTLFIHNSDMVKEFLLHEDHYIKAPILDSLKDELGLFFQNGEKAIRSKALFTKIFSHQGMDSLSPQMCDLIKNSFQTFDEKNQITTQTYKKIDLTEVFETIMVRIANLVVFGKTEILPESHAISKLHESLKEFFPTLRTLRYCIPFILFPKIAPKLGLVPPLRKIDELMKKQQLLIEEILEERRMDPTSFGENVIDRILEHNMECEKEQNKAIEMTLMDIVGNFNLFLFAGTDTSQNTARMALCHMADKPVIQEIVKSINLEIYPPGSHKTTNAALEGSERLSLWTKEVLRLHNPVARSSLRIATQNTSLNGIKINKGDRVSVLGDGLNFDKTVFSDPETFQIDRFSREKEKKYPKYQWVPFLVGKRVCLGRHLGEMMVKLLITQFVMHYDFVKPEDHDYYLLSVATTNVTNPLVLIKKRA